MASLPFALSVHHFISSVGADAGFASLIGLALLVLLYFAHARETATLRSRADEAGLRVQDLETQLADLADQVAALPAEISVRAAGPRVATAPIGMAQRAMAPGADGAALPPAAPAGVGAPALAAATRLIPMPELPVEEPEPATVGGNGSARIPLAASAGTVQRPAPVPAPATGPPPFVGGGRAVGGAGRSNGAQARPTGGQRPGPGRVGGQPKPGGRPVVPPRPAPKRSRTGRAILAVLVALVGAAVVVAAVVVLTNRGSSHKANSSVASNLTSHRTVPKGTVLVKPSTVTVSVLNGTDVNFLAANVWAKLAKEGFQKGAVADAANQTHTTSIVAYAAPADRADALAVAEYLKLSKNSVQQVDSGTKQVACSAAATGCSSLVYVTVGSDQSAQ
jgi:LytR cell envelope-related transcriptional attenuator